MDKRVHNHVDVAVEYGYKASTSAGNVFNFFNALGDVAFAYAGHNVVLEIQATIPSSPEKPSKGPMWRGVLIAYLVVAFCFTWFSSLTRVTCRAKFPSLPVIVFTT